MQNDKNLLLIFTYAPAGLGHLRVTDALYRGLPKNAQPIVLGSHDKEITFLHRLASASIFGRRIMEYFQYGVLEEIFTAVYRKFLRLRTKKVYEQLETLIEEYINPPKKVLIVSTHFSLAHQIAEIKNKLSAEKKVQIILTVQVTDDSPQKIWYVDNADVIFVPSIYTKKTLLDYGERRKLAKVHFEVVSYPVSPTLARTDDFFYRKRKEALSVGSQDQIKIVLPVSGAAVDLLFYEKMIANLLFESSRFHFYIISKEASFTKKFLEVLKGKTNVSIFSSKEDREVVRLYEKVYLENPIAVEISKPSEQAFKALIPFSAVGGSVLLFTNPVGRQEEDNLNFLIHHKLIPNKEKNEILINELLKEKEEIDLERIKKIALGLRGFCLPFGSLRSFRCVVNALTTGLFSKMAEAEKPKGAEDVKQTEVSADGVGKFWEKVEELLGKSG